jgi:hypothetical protein
MNRMYRTVWQIGGPKEAGELHNKELHNFYSSPNIIRVIK